MAPEEPEEAPEEPEAAEEDAPVSLSPFTLPEEELADDWETENLKGPKLPSNVPL